MVEVNSQDEPVVIGDDAKLLRLASKRAHRWRRKTLRPVVQPTDPTEYVPRYRWEDVEEQ